MQIETLAKPRVIVLTDITNEPDDEQSMVRFLCYTNEFDVEGLVATTSCWLRDKVVSERIQERVEAYGLVRNNLLKHASGYPETEYLLNVIKSGLPVYGMEGVGKGQSSMGSNLIIEVVDKPDPCPVWVCVWGGVNCLAQALWEVKHNRSREEIDAFVSKLRIYTISDQDNTAPWIRRTFPNLFYIVSPGYEENGGGAYHYATWVGISGDKFHGRFDGADFSMVDNPWLDQHIRQNHGPLGELHPQTKYLLEGDTPTFLYLIPNGLGVPEKPNYGNWEGRYEFYIPNQQKWHYEQEARPIWTDAVDEVIGIDGKTYKTNQATIWRWRQASQHDFAARIDWTVAENYQDANHNPVAAFSHDTSKGVVTLEVKSGEVVTLSAAGTFDPDGHNILYYWFLYKDFEFVDGITITAWIRPTLKAGPGTWQLIAAKGRDVHEFFEILLHPTGFIWMGWKLTGGRAVPDKSPLDVKKNVWQHIAVSYQSGKWWTTYLNGEVLIDYPKKNDKLIPLDAPLFLGAEEPLGMNRYYNGDTDDFAIFNRGLSQDEIKQVQAGMGKIMAIQPQAKLHTAWVRLKTKYLQ